MRGASSLHVHLPFEAPCPKPRPRARRNPVTVVPGARACRSSRCGKRSRVSWLLLAAGLAVYFLRPDQEHTIEEIVGHFHLNPAGHTSHIFQRALEHLQGHAPRAAGRRRAGVRAAAFRRGLRTVVSRKRWGLDARHRERGAVPAARDPRDGGRASRGPASRCSRSTWRSSRCCGATARSTARPPDPMRRAFLDLHPAATARRHGARCRARRASRSGCLLLAALSDGETTIDGLLDSDDTTVMREALAALGVPLRVAGSSLIVTGGRTVSEARGRRLRRQLRAVDPHADRGPRVSPTGRYRLHGVARMHERPIGDLVRRADARRCVHRLRSDARLSAAAHRSGRPARVDRARTPRRCQRIEPVPHRPAAGRADARGRRRPDDDRRRRPDLATVRRPDDRADAPLRRRGPRVADEPLPRVHAAHATRAPARSRSKATRRPRPICSRPACSAADRCASKASRAPACRAMRASSTCWSRWAPRSRRGDDATTVGSRGVASGFRLRAIDADFKRHPRRRDDRPRCSRCSRPRRARCATSAAGA